MKYLILIITNLMLTGCCLTEEIYCRERDSATIVEPLMRYPYNNGFIDVTTSTIDYY